MLTLDPVAVLPRRLAWEAVAEYRLEALPREYVVARASHVPSFQGQATARLILAFMLAEVLYAWIHVLGWNAEFASAKLQLAWRIACCTIGGGGIFVAVFGFSWAFADAGEPYWDQT
ncbi:hypothetical protein K438DRAFT_1760405 [Mycena galopus ATCC 62051]|nr:hypothetical protein K438DRAFT_1760405 [Mycena galopus ATCC 62051]